MVYGDIVDEWNDYAVENVFWQVRSFIRPVHAYTWIWQSIVSDSTGHILPACLIGAATGGGQCLYEVFLRSEKKNKLNLCTWAGCGINAVTGGLSGMLMKLPSGAFMKIKLDILGGGSMVSAGNKIANQCCSD